MTIARTLASIVLAAAAIAPSGCNVFKSTEECSVATDCPRGTTCTESKYCRSGGPIPLGLMLTLSGAQASSGEARHVGFTFANWILTRNDSTKVLGRGLTEVVRDTLGSVPDIPRVTNDVLTNNVAAVLGPFSSAEVVAAQQITYPEHLLHVGVEAGAATVGDAQPADLSKRFLFQLTPEIRFGIVRGIPLFLRDPAHPASYDVCRDGIALIVNDDTTGASFKSTLNDLLPKNCIPVTQSVSVPRDKKADYTAEVDTLLGANKGGKPTQCLFMATFPSVSGEVLRTLAQRAKATNRVPYSAFFGSGVLDDPSFASEAKSPIDGQPSLAEGFHGVDADVEPPRAEYRDLKELWGQFLDTHPDAGDRDHPRGETFLWTEATLLVALALEQAGRADDPDALRDAFVEVAQPNEGDLVIGPKDMVLAFQRIRGARSSGGRKAGIDYRGALTDYDFSDRGFVDFPSIVYKFENGKPGKVKGYTPEELKHAWDDPGPGCAK